MYAIYMTQTCLEQYKRKFGSTIDKHVVKTKAAVFTFFQLIGAMIIKAGKSHHQLVKDRKWRLAFIAPPTGWCPNTHVHVSTARPQNTPCLFGLY